MAIFKNPSPSVDADQSASSVTVSENEGIGPFGGSGQASVTTENQDRTTVVNNNFGPNNNPLGSIPEDSEGEVVISDDVGFGPFGGGGDVDVIAGGDIVPVPTEITENMLLLQGTNLTSVVNGERSNTVILQLPASREALEDLTDTRIINAAQLDFLIYNGSEWVNRRASLNDLQDVNIVSPMTDQVLTYDGAKWEATNIGTGIHQINGIDPNAMGDFNISPGAGVTLAPIANGIEIRLDTTGLLTSVRGGTALTSTTMGTTATVSLDDTAVTPGMYTNANITVDAQGRITAASNGASIPIPPLVLNDETHSVNVGDTPSDISATFTASGGTPPYMYSISGAGTTITSSGVATALSGSIAQFFLEIGTRAIATVTVTDANNNTATANFRLRVVDNRRISLSGPTSITRLTTTDQVFPISITNIPTVTPTVSTNPALAGATVTRSNVTIPAASFRNSTGSTITVSITDARAITGASNTLTATHTFSTFLPYAFGPIMTDPTMNQAYSAFPVSNVANMALTNGTEIRLEGTATLTSGVIIYDRNLSPVFRTNLGVVTPSAVVPVTVEGLNYTAWVVDALTTGGLDLFVEGL